MDNAPNPYAAPDEAAQAPAVASRSSELAKGIPGAIAALNRHLADPEAVMADRALAGGKVTKRTVIPGAIAIVLVLGGAACFVGEGTGIKVIGGIAAFLGFVSLIITIVNLVGELGLVVRSAALTPDAAAMGWLRAIRLGRGGYVISALCPTARSSEVEVPELAPVETGKGVFVADSPSGIAGWFKTFARTGTGQVRWMKIHAVRVVRIDGDVAEVEARIRFQSWPSWANIVSVVLFLLVRFIGIIVGLVLFYSLRKRREATITKILLRGRDGAWYLLRPGLDDA